jgi:hypothetical protein
MSKNLKKIVSNPFVGDQFFETEVLAKDSSIKHTNQNTLINSKKRFLHNNSIFMSFKQQYINFTHLITKNAIVATLIMLIALTTVGASATELLAPTEYKPSTQIKNLFTANKQKETDPYTALKPDSKNDVVISESCDLAIKYPKQIQNKKINVYNYSITKEEIANPQNYRYGTLAINGGLNDMELASKPSDRLHDFVIGCFDKNYDRNQIVSKEAYQGERGTSYRELTKEELRTSYGWFITEADLQNITLYKAQSPSGEIQENILFDYGNKLYWIYVAPFNGNSFGEELNPNGVFGEQVQLQFNSLVKNEANAQIVEKKPQTQKDTIKTQPLVADSEHDVVVIKECDLAVRFKKGQQFYKNANVPAGIFTKSTGLKDSDNFEVGYAGFSLNMSEMAPEISMSVLCMPGKYDFQEANPNRDASKDSAILRKSETNILDIKKYGIELKNLPENLVVNQANGDIPCCGLNNEGALYLTFENNDNTVLIRYSNFSNDHENLFEIQAQPNSLAPSTPSVKLENKSQTNQKTYTNSRYPNISFTYNSGWTVNEDFNSNLPSADYIKITKDNSKIELFFPRGVGSQSFYQCFNSSDIQILGKFIYFINSNGDRTVAPAEKFVLQNDSNFNSIKEQVKNWTVEQNQSMIPTGNMPLPSPNDNICQNGWDYFFGTKSTLDSNYPAPFEINVTNTNHTEAKEILKSLKY